MKVASPNIYQDDSGQWWYRFGTRNTRTRCEVRVCANCHEEYVASPNHHTPTCSRSCGVSYSLKLKPRAMGELNHHWHGGRHERRGYVYIYMPEHPSVVGKGVHQRYVREHRLVMEKMLGRYLYQWEVVHHKNGVKNDNRPENLELWVNGHPPGQRHEEGHKHCATCTCFD